jgi:hypothetical protein
MVTVQVGTEPEAVKPEKQQTNRPFVGANSALQALLPKQLSQVGQCAQTKSFVTHLNQNDKVPWQQYQIHPRPSIVIPGTAVC